MSKLYPPYVESTIPAQMDGGRGLQIPFRLNRAVSPVSIYKVCARIKTVSTSSWLGTIETDDFHAQPGTDHYQANFLDLKGLNLVPGQYYKIQLAFIDVNGVLGYYSTVGVFKYTARPSVYIEGLGKNISNLYTYVGVYSQGDEDQDPTEKIYTYQFDLYEGSTVIASSGVQLHDSTQDEYPHESRDVWVLNQPLVDGIIYQIKYTVTTINGLTVASPGYNITNSELDYEADNLLQQYLKFDNNFENGYVRLYCTAREKAFKTAGGGFVISRASSEDNYESWNDIMKFTLAGSYTSLPTELFKDFSVAQGVGYKYALQRYNDSGFYTSRMLFSDVNDKENCIALADFEDMFLYDGSRQLKIRFNPKVSSFKATVLESKLDTIGGKHPFIFRNGNVKYKEFSISGLISYLADMDEMFMSDAELGFMEEHARREGTPHAAPLRSQLRGTQVDTVNIAAERTFKLEVLDWLTNGKPKLFRSPGEGNYIIRLLNVSLSPNDTVSRMLHTFQGSACEIADYNFENLIKYGFIEEKTINNEVLVFESIDFAKSAYKAGVARYSVNYLESWDNGVYFAEFRDTTPGAIFAIKFLNGRGDLTIQIPHNGHYTINIFNDPLMSVTLKSLPEDVVKIEGLLDIGYYSTSTVGDFGDVRKVAICDQPYTQYGSCDIDTPGKHPQYYSSSNNTIDALDDIKFKTGYFYYLKAETRNSEQTLYYSDGKYYDNADLEEVGVVTAEDLIPSHIYPIKDPVSNKILCYMDGNTSRLFSYPNYSISIQLEDSDKLETIKLGTYDSAGRYVLPALSKVKRLMIGSGVWLECMYQEKEYIYCVEEDDPEIKAAHDAWLATGTNRADTSYIIFLHKLNEALINQY